MLCVAFSIIEILSNCKTSISLKELSKFDAERYFQINLLVLSLGSKTKSGLVWWARWKSKIDFSDIEVSILEL